MKRATAVAACLLVVLTGCEFLSNALDDEHGSLRLYIVGSGLEPAKTVMPPLDMTPAWYDIDGTGPGGATL